ncbi:MAG TPA: hypothetical protein VFV32_09145 [Acidimicrobiales bacterium]|jgi:hypothetical protein|nr:hypothetical protein [Acidimicrobiales bacterium]
MAADRRDELARAGLEHLQAAAHEVIKATRSLLDAAEELIDDPAAVQQVVATLASVAQAAASRLRSTERPDPEDRTGPDEDDDEAPDEGRRGGRVQRIRVS